MRKIIFSALLAAAICACTQETINYLNPVPGENQTGKNTTLAIASRNTLFTSVDDSNASVAFKSLGGKVILDVNTNTNWDFEVSGDTFIKGEKDTETNQLTLSCDQNTIEKKLSATVTIKAGDKTATITATQNAYGTVEIVASENNFHLAAKGELTASFEVTSTDPDWTFETAGCEWMLVSRDGATINISAYPNETYTDRDVKFILNAGSGDNATTETIDVLQDRSARIEPSALTIPVTPFSSDAKDVEIKANFDWEYSISGNESGWLAIEKTENGFRFIPTANPGEETRTVKITVTAGDGKANVDSKEITISQPGIDTKSFILGLNVTEKALTSMIPVGGVTSGVVDWGDGTSETISTEYPSHTYTDPGFYIASFKGSANTINSYNKLNDNQRYQIEEVYSWGDLGITSMDRAFYNCDSLRSIPTDIVGSFAKVKSFDEAFSGCELIETIPSGLFSKATEVESLYSTFIYCYSVKEIPADLLYNCPKLTDLRNTFDACSEVTEIDKDLLSRNPELTNCSSTFSRMFKLKSISEDLFANNPKITTFNSVFNRDSALTVIPAGIFRNQPDCESFRMAFTATGITEIPAGLFSNNKKCTSFQMTFYKTPIQSIPADVFEGCSNVTNFSSCFNGCENLKSIPADLFKNSGSQAKVATNGINMVFQKCTSLEEVPAGLFDGFTKITQFTSVFADCSSLKAIPEGLFNDMSAVKTFSNVFQNCTALTSIPSGAFKGLANVTSFAGVFAGCTGITEVGANLLEGCNANTNISNLFKGCTNLSKISEDAFKGSVKVTNISGLFNGCTNLKEVPEGLFADLSAATNAKDIFSASGIQYVPAGLFSSSVKITSFENAFMGCTALTNIPDGLFSANSKVTTYKTAFKGCTSLASVGTIFGASTAKISLESTFEGCTALKTLPAGLFDGLTAADSFKRTFWGDTDLESIPEGLFAKNINATTLDACFQNCTSLKAVPAKLFGTTTKTKTLSNLFSGCSSIESVAADAFDGLNANNGNAMKMFEKCVSLKEVPSGLFKNTKINTYTNTFNGCTSLQKVGSQAINCGGTSAALSSMFVDCTNLREVSADMFISPENVTGITYLFQGCSALESVPVSLFDNFKKLKYANSVFDGCVSLSGESPYTIVNGVKYHLYERTADNATASGFVAITNLKGSFKGCTKLTDYAQIPDVCKEN